MDTDTSGQPAQWVNSTACEAVSFLISGWKLRGGIHTVSGSDMQIALKSMASLLNTAHVQCSLLLDRRMCMCPCGNSCNISLAQSVSTIGANYRRNLHRTLQCKLKLGLMWHAPNIKSWDGCHWLMDTGTSGQPHSWSTKEGPPGGTRL